MDRLFYLEKQTKEDCCGCRGCEQICPTGCIYMVHDEEGFAYPNKDDEKCIDCGLCERVCPNVNHDSLSKPEKSLPTPLAYMAIHNDLKILNHSASGGVFSAIVNSYCKDNFVIFGVEMNDDFQVIHSYTETIEGVAKYRKSKYVQSDIGDCYSKAEEFLKAGKRVLFTGTPCQIAGLRLFLRKDYQNLFCVDLVCHGVPSQKIFDTYRAYLESNNKGELIAFGFRHKTLSKSGQWNSRNVKYAINNKNIIRNSLQDPFLRGYHSGLFYRPSCYECKFANAKRVSDITMADFWGVENLFPNEDVHRGVSVLLVNTQKGKQLVEEIGKEMRLEKVDLNYVISSNGQLNHPAKLHSKREIFFELMATKRFDKAVGQCIPKPSYVRRLASRLLSPRSKEMIRKVIGS